MNEDILQSKTERLVGAIPKSPQQVQQEQLLAARSAMDSFYMDTYVFKEEDIELEETSEQDEDSIEPVKRTNPKVGRNTKPQRKSIS
jgi:hypothetical protein